MSAVIETKTTDWSQFAGREMTIGEVQKMSLDNQGVWGWIDAEGHQMFIAGTDDFIALRFAKGNTYEPVTRALWRKLCAGAPIVADIGTHSGLFTLEAFKSGAQTVFSAEPNPFNYSRLVINIKKNGYPLGGACYVAIGDKNKIGMLLVKGGLYRLNAAGRMDLQSNNGEEVPVRVRRMDSILPESAWPGLKVVKIDAENYTPNVLVGMGKMLEHRPDLIIECTDHGMGEILKPYGYKFWRIWETGSIEECDDLVPYNPGNNYNGTHDDCRNRFASCRGLP